jgi:cell division transport system permease protein
MKKTFLALIIGFIFFNIFLSVTLNLFSLTKKEEGKLYISVELKSNTSLEERKRLEQSFLKIPEINKVTFYGREKAFEKLQKDLELSLPKSENPLPDTFFLYFKNIDEIEKIQSEIEKEQGIKEFFIDYDFLKIVQKKSELYKKITLFSVMIFIVPSILLIYFIFQTGLGYEILRRKLMNPEGKNLEKNSKIYSIILSVAASLIGILIYFNLYFYCRREIIKLDSTFTMLSFFEIFYYQVGATVICNMVALVNPRQLISKRSVEE